MKAKNKIDICALIVLIIVSLVYSLDLFVAKSSMAVIAASVKVLASDIGLFITWVIMNEYYSRNY